MLFRSVAAADDDDIEAIKGVVHYGISNALAGGDAVYGRLLSPRRVAHAITRRAYLGKRRGRAIQRQANQHGGAPAVFNAKPCIHEFGEAIGLLMPLGVAAASIAQRRTQRRRSRCGDVAPRLDRAATCYQAHRTGYFSGNSDKTGKQSCTGSGLRAEVGTLPAYTQRHSTRHARKRRLGWNRAGHVRVEVARGRMSGDIRPLLFACRF